MVTNKQKIIIGVSIGVTALVGFLLFKKSTYKKNVIKFANNEWAKFGYQERDADGNWIRQGRKENEDGWYQRVGMYWKGIGKNYDGRDRDVAWSSAFIGWVMGGIGGVLGVPFTKSASHSKYIRDYVANRKEGRLDAPFVAYRLNEKPAKVGDLLCYSRESATDLYDKTGSYKSHCDIVVAVKPNEIQVIGGNVNQSVSKKVLKAQSGYLLDTRSKWFAIIKNNV
jgi:hypothetical protein